MKGGVSSTQDTSGVGSLYSVRGRRSGRRRQKRDISRPHYRHMDKYFAMWRLLYMSGVGPKMAGADSLTRLMSPVKDVGLRTQSPASGRL